MNSLPSLHFKWHFMASYTVPFWHRHLWLSATLVNIIFFVILPSNFNACEFLFFNAIPSCKRKSKTKNRERKERGKNEAGRSRWARRHGRIATRPAWYDANGDVHERSFIIGREERLRVLGRWWKEGRGGRPPTPYTLEIRWYGRFFDEWTVIVIGTRRM